VEKIKETDEGHVPFDSEAEFLTETD